MMEFTRLPYKISLIKFVIIIFIINEYLLCYWVCPLSLFCPRYSIICSFSYLCLSYLSISSFLFYWMKLSTKDEKYSYLSNSKYFIFVFIELTKHFFPYLLLSWYLYHALCFLIKKYSLIFYRDILLYDLFL